MKIGILGGGQLGLMLAESLLHLSAEVTVLDPDPDSPASLRLAGVVKRPYDDAAALKSLFATCDAVTFDSENVPAGPLAAYGAKLKPSLHVLQTSQDRAKEKAFLAHHHFPVVAHQAVPQGEDLKAAARAFGLPCIAKSTLGGYDGKGQYKLEHEADLDALPTTSPAGGWVLEERLQLHAELSCIVARSHRGEAAFPVFENVHHNHILDFTVLPARVDAALQNQAREIAIDIARALDVEGLLTVEFFVAQSRHHPSPSLFVNELAPRTHNSGHVTRQACTVSQFDALARILCGLEPGSLVLHPGAWCMGQLLGDVWLQQGRTGGALDLSCWADFPDVVDVFLYGKREARPNRKMGHFVVHGPTSDVVLKRAAAFRAALQISKT